MALVSLRGVSIAFGGPTLLDKVDWQVERGERVGLVGRNGAGKSTLLKLLHGDLAPDEGEVLRPGGVRVARLIQEVPEGRGGTVFDEVAAGIDEGDGGHTADHAIDRVLSRMKLDPDIAFASLSSGMKRRVLLARSLAREPDVLLLDEPTNHLDIESIRWLEDHLLRFGGTLVFVTHDRTFLGRLATRIVEVDRARLFDWSCDYPTFLERKEAALGGRGAPGGPLRQAAGPGGGLDSQGHPGPPDPQRGAGPGAQGPPRGAPRTPRADRQRPDAGPGSRAVGLAS